MSTRPRRRQPPLGRARRETRERDPGFPLLEGDDFDRLCQSIETHGLLESIVTRNGVVIDGRNRLRACLQVGVQPRFAPYDAPTDVQEYIWAKNVDRRHLDDDQRAAVSLRWEEYEANRFKGQKLSHPKRGGDKPVEQEPVQRDNPGGPNATKNALAQRADVSRYKIEQAQKGLRWEEPEA